MFIDATYEGDLMAAAGVSYHVGREAHATYGEQWNGVQTGVLHHRHHFGVLPSEDQPLRRPGRPASGVLPRISTEPPGDYGAGDTASRPTASACASPTTRRTASRSPSPRATTPQYELLLRIYAAGWRETFDKFDPIPNRKTDTNNHGPFSTDNIGMNYDYPEASYERRREIIREHETYQQGWLYFIANDPRVPKEVPRDAALGPLPKDEFKDNGHWPHQIYVREARRMVGRLRDDRERTAQKARPTPESVGMGSLHDRFAQRAALHHAPRATCRTKGDIGVPTRGPLPIAYGSLVPKRGQRPTTCSCRSASPAPTSPSAPSAWSRCS
jgi:hypothetical protein